jgi:exportin-1
MFSVVTDTSHTAGLTLHASILAYMFSMVETETIKVPLGTGSENNVTYIQGYLQIC